MVKRIGCLLLAMVMVVGLFPVLAQAESTDLARVISVGFDTATKGAWEGVYGAEAAVLFGYNHTEERTYDSGGRYAFYYGDYSCDYVSKAADSPLTAYAYVNNSNPTKGKLWSYAADATDESVLNMPAGSTLTKFQVYTSAGSEPYPGDADKSAWRRATFTFDISDEDYHQFSFYTNQTTKSPIYVTIVDKETKAVLYEDEYGTEAFSGGAYVSYLIKGSFELYLDKTRNSDYVFGFSGFFVDQVNENETADLTAAAGSAPEEALLRWTETEGIHADTKVIIERMAEGETVWTTLATVNSGVKQYTDKGLKSGSVYYYRLKTITGVTRSMPGETLEYTHGQVEVAPRVYKIGMDSATKGAWEGVYGAEAAVLFGYSYTGTRDFSGSGGRFAYAYGDYSCDYVGKPENSPLVSYKYVTEGKLWTYAGNDDSVLDMPAGSTLEKYKVYTAAGTLPYKNDPNNTDKAAWKRATFTIELSDDKYHQISFYSNLTTTAPIYVTIVDKDTKEVLLTDVYDTTAFSGGAYVSYLVKGSFELYLEKTNNKDYAFGFCGFFVDAAAENETSALAVTAGPEARSAALSWQERESTSADTKIMIERKTGDDGKWVQLAVVNSGVKSYLDTGLEAGVTYSYRLKTQTGIAATTAGEAVSYTVPAYQATSLRFDRELYAASSSAETVTVKVTLKNADDALQSGCTVKLQADFGHNVQQIAGVQTDEGGIATFTFQPAYLGNATLTAIFEDDDSKQLMNSKAESALFVGQTQWEQAPVLYRISDGILPGDLISINGYGIKAEDMSKVVIKYAPHTAATAPAQPPESAQILEKLQDDARDGYYIVTQLPVDAQPGLYDVWVGNAHGYSEPITLNTARPLFISEYEVWEGQSISVSGRNLLAAQFGADTQTMVRLRSGSNSYVQSLTKVTPYSINFTVTDTPLGEYQVEISNDGGVSWSGLSSDQTLTVVEKGADPLNIGYAWMDHFAWENLFDVTDYGADGTDTEDDTAAVNAAIQAAKASASGGGILYFPDGNYYLQGVQIPNNIVLQGESTEGTVLYYIGAGENMFENTDGIGHVGFAKFTVKLADDAVRPDTFFWLGHPWDASANDVAYRTASEVFLKEVNLTYGMTKETGMDRGLGVVALGKERCSIQDCAFSGFAADMHHIKFNEYSGYYRNRLDYDDGYLGTTASYSFVEDCTIIGGLRKSGQNDNHGIFGHQFVHMENNYVESVGSVKNDGEPYAVEAPTGDVNYGSVINATANTVSFVPECGALQNHYAITHGRLAVRITNGKGMGQQRNVASIDAATNTITLTEDWTIIPDSSCIVTLIVPLDNVTFYNNVQVDSAKGTYLYGNMYDAVVANLTSIDSDGIYVHSSNVKGDRAIQSAFVTIRDNKLSGVSPRTNDVKIAVQTTRRNNGSEYFAVGIYGIEIRNNQLEGVRGAVSEAQNSEAPSGSGLISWAGVKGDGNSDGYCGDNTNVLMENNTLTNVDTAITTTLGDYGFVLKGNLFDNVGEELSNTNTAGTGNLLVLDANRTEKIVADFAEVWKNIDGSKYTCKSYEALCAAVENAMAVSAETSTDELVAALQELRIAAGALKLLTEAHSAAKIGDKLYGCLDCALAGAKRGDTVIMLADAEVEKLVLSNGITLDLNGCDLTASYLVAFTDNAITDSANGTGLVHCENVRLDPNNPTLPAWDDAAEGYRFFEMLDQRKMASQDANGFVFFAKPALGTEANNGLMAKISTNQLRFKIRMRWSNAGSEVEQLFSVKEETVASTYSQSGQVIMLTVSGAGSYAGKLLVDVYLESETGVIWTSRDLTFTGQQ